MASASNELLLKIQSMRKAFGDQVVLKDVSMDVHKGDVVAILGPSGSGKTTMLRCLNFLEHADGGTLAFRRRAVWPQYHIPPRHSASAPQDRVCVPELQPVLQ